MLLVFEYVESDVGQDVEQSESADTRMEVLMRRTQMANWRLWRRRCRYVLGLKTRLKVLTTVRSAFKRLRVLRMLGESCVSGRLQRS